MDNFEIIYIVFVVALLTLCGFNLYSLVNLRARVKNLLQYTQKESLESYLESITAQNQNTKQQLDQLMDLYSDIKIISQKSLQKVSLIRFNPFKDTGGDQSFVLCILDHTDSGILLTAIHNREGTRVYTKNVKNSQTDLSISDEEKQALTQAIKNKAR